MGVLQILIILIVFGVVLWLVNTYIPMPQPIKAIINVVAVVAILIWLLRVSGLF